MKKQRWEIEWTTHNASRLVEEWERLTRYYDLIAVNWSNDYADYTRAEFDALDDDDKEGVWALMIEENGVYLTLNDVVDWKD